MHKCNHLTKISPRSVAFFSHHPPCIHFADHTFQIGQKSYCIGCYIGYPAGVLGILFGGIALQQNWLELFSLLLIGVVGLVLFFLLSVFHLTRWKTLKIVQKFGMGITGGMLMVYSYVQSPGGIFVKLLNTSFVFSIIMGPILLYHYFSMRSVCDRCPDQWQLPICSPEYCLARRPIPEGSHKEIHKETNKDIPPL
ncbi:MAG: hypothetical protein ACTSVZ_08670 [Promethearchaeota archaeon]